MLVVLSIVFLPATVGAQTLDGKYQLHLWGLSYHTHKPTGNQLNEKNPGIGLRYYFRDPLFCQTFAEGDYIARNTMRGEVFAIGVGAQCPILKLKGAEFFVGGVIGYGSYENPTRHKVYRGVIGMPIVGVRHEGVSLNLGVLPVIGSKSNQWVYMLFVGIERTF